CSTPNEYTSLDGKVFVTPRGGCSFADKAHTVAPGKPSALIVVNNETSLFHM
ncbi:unnamed protein product, partial [Discosporangium mesarthrocarpum]